MSSFSRATTDGATRNQPIIKATNLTKMFGEFCAVDGIDFEVMPGEIFGMLGPNGAGKTTTMRMISCISPVTSGELHVDGLNVSVASRLVRDRIGVVAQHDGLDPDLKVEQNLVAYARYFGMDGKRATARAREMLGFFDLSDRSDDGIHSLSGGMRRRLSLARAFMTRPRTVILDEPSTGLDPHSRNRVWDQLGRIKDAGATILMSTHYMEEAAALCDRLIIMDLGRILAVGTPDDLIIEHAGTEMGIVRPKPGARDSVLAQVERRELDYVDRGAALAIATNGKGRSDFDGIEDAVVTFRPANLEDVFLNLTGKRLRDE